MAVLTPAIHAAALGNPEGAVLIGRPLDLTFAATGHPDGDAPCLEAELLHGDVRIDPRRVQLQWFPGPPGRATVHVRSAVPVFEPVVTLTLRVGCLRELSRRYVLLADPVTEMEPAIANVPMAPRVAAAPSAAPATAAATPSAAIEAGTGPATASAARPAAATGPRATEGPANVATPAPTRPRRSVEARAATQARARPARQATAAQRGSAVPPATAVAGPTKPRLVLDPPVLAPQTRAAPAAVGQPASAPAAASAVTANAPALAASQPGTAASAPSDEAALNAQRIKALERDMAALVEQSRKSNDALALMGRQLQQAREERDFLSRVLAGAAMLLALAAVGWAWWRRRENSRPDRWWQESEAPELDEYTRARPSQAAPAAVAAAAVAAAAPGEDRPADEPEPIVHEGMDITDAPSDSPTTVPGILPPQVEDAPAAAAVSAAAVAAAAAAGDDGSMRQPHRTTQADELMDVRAQADFFISIGRHQHAFALLNAQNDDSQQTGPLAWLDLLDMYQALGRAQDFDRVRKAFERNFNAVVPTMEDYNKRGSLETHTKLMDRVIEQWPKRRVLDIMEEALFRRAGAADTKRLDYWSFRDLLFLYQVARDLVEADVGTQVRDANMARAADPVVEAVPTYLDHDHFDTTPVPDSELSWPAEGDLDLDLSGFDPLALERPPAGDEPPAEAPAQPAAQAPDLDLDFDVLQDSISQQLPKGS